MWARYSSTPGRWMRRNSAASRGSSNCEGTTLIVTSPDAARLFAHHRLPRLARESPRELRHVGDHAVDAPAVGRMHVGERVQAQHLGPLVAAAPLRHADEEALLGRVAVARLQRLAGRHRL